MCIHLTDDVQCMLITVYPVIHSNHDTRKWDILNGLIRSYIILLSFICFVYIVEGRILEPGGGYIGLGIICMGSVGVLVFFQRLQHRIQCMITAVYNTTDTYEIHISV
jgi:hypothetical protein